MRRALPLAAIASIASIASIAATACTAFVPAVGPLREREPGACATDESGEYGDAAYGASATEDAGCGGDS